MLLVESLVLNLQLCISVDGRLDSGVHLRDVVNAVNFLFIGRSFDSIVLALILTNCYITQVYCTHARYSGVK